MSNNGYNLSVSPRMSYALLSFQFYYTNAWGNKDKIKVEINFLDRVHILPLKSKPLLVALIINLLKFCQSILSNYMLVK